MKKKNDAAEVLKEAAPEAARFLVSALSDEGLTYSQRADAAKLILDRVLGKAGGGLAEAEGVKIVLEKGLERYAD